MRALWTPVGSGVGHVHNLRFIINHFFADETGKKALAAADQTIRKLPGMKWFDLVVRHTDRLRDPVQDASTARAAA